MLLIICGAGAYFFYAANAMTVIRLSSRIMQEPLYMIVGFIGIVALIELCRRLRGHSHSVRGRRAAGVHFRQPDG